MTPTDKDQALPSFELNGTEFYFKLKARVPNDDLTGWSHEDRSDPRVKHLSAQLAALDPSTRARVLEPYQSEVMTRLERLAERIAVRHDDELTAARGEVERLRARCDAAERAADAAHSFMSSWCSDDQADEEAAARRLRDALETWHSVRIETAPSGPAQVAVIEEPEPKEPTT